MTKIYSETFTFECNTDDYEIDNESINEVNNFIKVHNYKVQVINISRNIIRSCDKYMDVITIFYYKI